MTTSDQRRGTRSPEPPPNGDEAGDQTADAKRVDVVALVHAYHADVYAYAYRLTCAAADAEDLTQQTFLMAVERSQQIRHPDKARSWLFAVARSRFLKNQRRRGLLPTATIELDSVPDGDIHDESPWDYELLDQALAALPSAFRIVIMMYYFEDLSYKDIAEQLELPIGTVMSRLARGKDHLRKRMTLGASPTT